MRPEVLQFEIKTMAEKAQAKVQVSVQRFVEEVDRGGLRRMEKEMHECAARCCAKEDLPIREVHACVEKCSDKTKRAQNLVQGELQRFQEGLSRCVAQCQDDIKDQVRVVIVTVDLQLREVLQL